MEANRNTIHSLFAPEPIRSLERNGRPFCSRERKFLRTFAPWNSGSRNFPSVNPEHRTLLCDMRLTATWWLCHQGPGHFAPESESSRERNGQEANGPGSERAKGRKGQEANWPGCYWPIRSWERIGPGAKRLGTQEHYTLYQTVLFQWLWVDTKLPHFVHQSSFISGMTESRPRIHNKHNIHNNSSRVTCLIFVFIEHSCNEVTVWQACGVWWQL